MKALHDLPLPAPLRAAIQAVRNRLTAECSVERLMLFGSVVRGEADAESDADLLIVLTERPTTQIRDRITSLILDINLAYDTRSYWIPGSWHVRMMYTDGIPFHDPSEESDRAGQHHEAH